MIWLLLSIAASVSIYTVFKWVNNWKVPLFPVIILNYATCMLLGLLLLTPSWEVLSLVFSQSWFFKCLGLGSLFIFIFVCMVLTTAYFGIATTSVASKMALIVPSLFFLYYDQITPEWYFWPGLLLSFPAIFLLTFSRGKTHYSGMQYLFFPLIVWLGSGLIDTFLKLLELEMADFPNKQIWQSTTIFTGAFITGLLLLAFRSKKNPTPLPKIMKAGVLLGIPNFASIWFLLLAFSESKLSPSVLLPVNNIGIVGTSVLVSIIFFKESTSPRKWLGFVLALSSIILMSLADAF
jgi:multidrug transporter EmrE-like cation transporter